jgi:adenosylhomocysteinase
MNSRSDSKAPPSRTNGDCLVRDAALAGAGRKAITLAEAEMPGLMEIRATRREAQPLAGARIAGSLHMTVETAVLIETLVVLGAELRWSSSNRFSTNDPAAAALVDRGIPVFAWKGCTEDEYWDCLHATLTGPGDWTPNLVLDDGGDLTELIHQDYPELLAQLRGFTEETTSGATRVRKLESAAALGAPVIVVNDSVTKSKFDNVYGCRESMLDGLKRATDVMVAGRHCVVVGFGDVGKGCSESFRAMGAHVTVVEIDPICALQAAMQGYSVGTMDDVAASGDIFITATGCKDVISRRHLDAMRHGAIVGNMGHSDTEFDIRSLHEDPSISTDEIKPLVREFIWPNGKRLIALAEGRLMNLGCATGHPPFVMSASFSNQTLALIELWTRGQEMSHRVHRLPKHLDEEVARLHLDHLGARLTRLTEDQADYLGIAVDGPFKGEAYRY